MRNWLICVAVLAGSLTLSAQPPSEAIRPFSIQPSPCSGSGIRAVASRAFKSASAASGIQASSAAKRAGS